MEKGPKTNSLAPLRRHGAEAVGWISLSGECDDTLISMSDITPLLSQIKQDDTAGSAEILPLVYDELRRLAAIRLAEETPGHTLQATALVHEAYLRLVDGENVKLWDSRGHFFAAAAEAMRRILVESARRKGREKHGRDFKQRELIEGAIPSHVPSEELLGVHEALSGLELTNPQAAQLVKLRYFAGFTIPETAELMQISPRKTNQIWTYARAWLATAIADARGD